MVIFDDLFNLFKSNTPSKKLEKLYSDLNKIASEVKDIAIALKERLHKLKKGKDMQLKKIEDIENHIIPYIEELAQKTEERFLQLEQSHSSEYFSDEEKIEIKTIIELLENTKKELEIVHNNLQTASETRVYDSLRTMKKLFEKFYKEKEKGKKLFKAIDPRTVSVVLKRVIKEAEKNNKIKVTEPELRILEKEVKEMNKCGDRNWKLKFRHFLARKQEFETDKEVPEKHINCTATFDGKKKALHFVLAEG